MNERTVLLRDIGINAGLPYATYLLLSYQGVPTVQALAAGAMFPVGAHHLWALSGERRVQALGMIVLVRDGHFNSCGAVFHQSVPGPGQRARCSRGSLGMALLVSLFARRPLVFHLATPRPGRGRPARTPRRSGRQGHATGA